MLEDHPDIPPKCIDVDLSVMRLDAIHDKLAIRNAFEPIDAPRRRAFTGAGRSNDDNDFPWEMVRSISFRTWKVPKIC